MVTSRMSAEIHSIKANAKPVAPPAHRDAIVARYEAVVAHHAAMIAELRAEAADLREQRDAWQAIAEAYLRRQEAAARTDHRKSLFK